MISQITQTNWRQKLWKSKGAIIFTAFALLLPACATGEVTRVNPQDNVTTEDVTENTNELIGQTVTIESEPIEKVSPIAFTIRDEQFFGGEPILVINSSGQPINFNNQASNELQVTGEVRQLVIADLERDYGLDLEPQLYTEYEQRPVILAESISQTTAMNNNGAIAVNQNQSQTRQRNVTTEEVSDNAENLIGQTVTIRSEIVDDIGSDSFTVSDEQLLGSEPILVINTSGEPFMLASEPNRQVQVTGEVGRFVYEDIEKQYSLDLAPELYEGYEDRPVILAESLNLAPDPTEITENPDRYYGQTLAVQGDVAEIYAPIGFTIDEDEVIGSNELLVLNANNQPNLNEGEQIIATGVLKRFDADRAEREYNLGWNSELRRQLEAGYQNKPVLILNRVQSAAIPQAQ